MRIILFFIWVLLFNNYLIANDNELNLPKTMVWSTYDLGASGYNEASAFAEALMQKYSIRVRLLPSGTSIGRLLALKKNRVSVAFLGSEVYFASEGIYDFADKKWGPQDLRVIIGRFNTFGIAVPATTDIKTVKDLKGKRVAYVTANPSLNVKLEAIMAFSDLTWDDVVPIVFPAFTPTIKALQSGRLDAAGAVPTGSAVYELAASKKGIRWVPMPSKNKEGWKKLNKIIPFMQPQIETLGAGLNNESPVELGGYRYPALTVYADANEKDVYNFIKAIDLAYDNFKDISPVMHKWKLELASGTPIEAPIHKGVIRYLEEKNLWSKKDEIWNNNRIKRLNALITGWDLFYENNKDLNKEKFKIKWLEERKTILAEY